MSRREVIEEALAFLATTPSVLITGTGGAAERLRKWADDIDAQTTTKEPQ